MRRRGTLTWLRWLLLIGATMNALSIFALLHRGNQGGTMVAVVNLVFDLLLILAT